MKDFARNSKLLDMVQEGPSEIEILQKEICDLKEENSLMKNIIEKEKEEKVSLQNEISTLLKESQLQEAQIKSYEPILQQNKELTAKIEVYESNAGDEETVEYYKRTVSILNQNVQDYLDEINRLRRIINDIKESTGRRRTSRNASSIEVLPTRKKLDANIKRGHQNHVKLVAKSKLQTTIIESHSVISNADSRLSQRTGGIKIRRPGSKTNSIKKPSLAPVILPAKPGQAVSNAQNSEDMGDDELEEFLMESYSNFKEMREMLSGLNKSTVVGPPKVPPKFRLNSKRSSSRNSLSSIKKT